MDKYTVGVLNLTYVTSSFWGDCYQTYRTMNGVSTKKFTRHHIFVLDVVTFIIYNNLQHNIGGRPQSGFPLSLWQHMKTI